MLAEEVIVKIFQLWAQTQHRYQDQYLSRKWLLFASGSFCLLLAASECFWLLLAAYVYFWLLLAALAASCCFWWADPAVQMPLAWPRHP